MPTRAKAKTSSKINNDPKWGKILTPRIVACLIFCAFCLIMIFVCIANPGVKENSVTSPIENLNVLDAITPNDRVTQKFTADGDYSRFGLYYANYGNYVQGGKLNIDIKDHNGETSKFSYDIGGIIDNAFLYIDYPLQKDKTYSMTIYPDGGAEGITFFTTASDNNYGAELTFNKKPEPVSIIMSFATEQKDTFAVWYYVLGIVLTLSYVSLKVNKEVYVKKS